MFYTGSIINFYDFLYQVNDKFIDVFYRVNN